MILRQAVADPGLLEGAKRIIVSGAKPPAGSRGRGLVLVGVRDE